MQDGGRRERVAGGGGGGGGGGGEQSGYLPQEVSRWAQRADRRGGGGGAQVALNPLLLFCGLHSSTRDGLHDDIEDLENRLTEARPPAVPIPGLRASNPTPCTA